MSAPGTGADDPRDTPDDTPPDVPTRTESWTVAGDVAEVELVLGAGRVVVELVEEGREVVVRVGAGQGGWWQQRLGGVLAALAPDESGPGRPDPAGAEAVAATDVSWSAHRDRLQVRSPQSGPLRAVPLEVAVTAPAGTRLRLRGSSAALEVSGRAGSLDAGTGSGEVTAGEVSGRLDVRTGSGAVRVGHVASSARLRTGSGDVAVDAAAADVEVVTGSGDVRLGVGAGVLAELDVRTGSGTARSELEVLDAAPDGTAVVLRARTGSGDVTVHAAVLAG